MNAWALFRQLLAVLAIVGLVAAPVATASMASVSGPAPIPMPMPMGTDDMDCCPPTEPSPTCPKSCPLMVACMAKCVHAPATPGPAVIIVPEPTAVAACCDDRIADRLADSLTPRPPNP